MEGRWGQHSGGQGRAELAQKGHWELRAGCARTQVAPFPCRYLVHSGWCGCSCWHRGPAVWGWMGAPTWPGMAWVAVVAGRALCWYLAADGWGLLGAGAARWALWALDALCGHVWRLGRLLWECCGCLQLQRGTGPSPCTGDHNHRHDWSTAPVSLGWEDGSC